MKVSVGSKNPSKLNAVKEVFSEMFGDDLEIVSKEIDLHISDQPMTMKETISGALDRAKKSFNDCDFSIGIEGGLMEVPYSNSGYMQFEACVLYDGKKNYLGLSGAFEIPNDVIEKIKKEGKNLSQAAKELGYTDIEYIGWDQGVVGVFTKGKIDRKIYTIHAIEMMLAHYKSKDFFE